MIWLGVGLLSGVLFGLYSLGDVLIPFITGLIGAYAFNGIVEKLNHFGLHRGVATSFVIFGTILLFIGLSFILFPYVNQQLVSLIRQLPYIAESIWQKLTPWMAEFSKDDLKMQFMSYLSNFLRFGLNFILNILSSGWAIANLLSLVLLTPLLMFYMLRDWPKITSQVESMIPPKHKVLVLEIAEEINQALSGYIRGQAQVSSILMILYSLILGLLGFQDGFLLGLVIGFLSFIPYLGTLCGFIIAILISLGQSWQMLWAMLGIFVVILVFENYYLTPKFIGNRINLHPVWIIFSILAFATWFGFIGIILALPISAILGVFCRNLLQNYKGSSWYLT